MKRILTLNEAEGCRLVCRLLTVMTLVVTISQIAMVEGLYARVLYPDDIWRPLPLEVRIASVLVLPLALAWLLAPFRRFLPLALATLAAYGLAAWLRDRSLDALTFPAAYAAAVVFVHRGYERAVRNAT